VTGARVSEKEDREEREMEVWAPKVTRTGGGAEPVRWPGLRVRGEQAGGRKREDRRGNRDRVQLAR
jgi:hypothetical protein